MMQVLHIFNALLPSGAETMWTAAAGILRDQKIETHALATATKVGPFAETMSAVGFVVHHLPYATGVKYIYALWCVMRRCRVQAVIVHAEQHLFTHALTGRLAGARVVCVHHSEFKWTGKSRLKRCVVVACLRIVGCRFVGVSESVCRNERRFGHTPQLIWNWIDEARFLGPDVDPAVVRRRFGLCVEDKVLLAVGNCSDIKNHAFLLRVLKCLPACYKLVHVGEEHEDVYHEREIAKRLGVDRRVSFLGPRSDLKDLFAAADVFVLSSICEGLGLSCLEAIYCGLPVVAGDVEGVRDISQNVSQCHLSPLTEDVFAKKICEIAAMKRPSVAECRAEVCTFISMERSVRQYLKLLRGP